MWQAAGSLRFLGSEAGLAARSGLCVQSTHSYPREIDFVVALPKTPSGKIQRFILRGEAR
jgi:acyl-coenzyme A synthetase/AMP-(fatty) acid ligase